MPASQSHFPLKLPFWDQAGHGTLGELHRPESYCSLTEPTLTERVKKCPWKAEWDKGPKGFHHSPQGAPLRWHWGPWQGGGPRRGLRNFSKKHPSLVGPTEVQVLEPESYLPQSKASTDKASSSLEKGKNNRESGNQGIRDQGIRSLGTQHCEDSYPNFPFLTWESVEEK